MSNVSSTTTHVGAVTIVTTSHGSNLRQAVSDSELEHVGSSQART